MQGSIIVLVFFASHWALAVLFQSFFHHRYAAHGMFTMSKRWERVFHFAAWLFQGSSYLDPRAYAILHREHHAYSDTPRDPHSPNQQRSLMAMMLRTKARFEGIAHRTITPEPRFEGSYPEWPALDRFGDRWTTRVAFIAFYAGVYLLAHPHPIFYLLLPVQAMMGPVHGAIVNWCGHRYGYRNFETSRHDRSRNVLPFDFVTMGELFQNNHHAYPMAPRFAARRFEIDPTWWMIRALSALRIVRLSPHIQTSHYVKPQGRVQAPTLIAPA